MRSALFAATAWACLVLSCTSAPPAASVSSPGPAAPAAPTAAKIPAWTLNALSQANGRLVIVVTGPSTSAPADLLRPVLEAQLGLVPGPRSPASGVAALKKFLDDASQTAPAATFAQAGTGWWQFSFDLAAWEADKARLAGLLTPPVDPVADLEAAAAALEAQGLVVEAGGAWLKAAAAAVAPGAPAQPARFQASLARVRALASTLSLTAAPGRLEGPLGKAWAGPLVVTLTSAGKPLNGVALRFSYPAKKAGSRPTVAGQTLTTDAQGTAALALPVPDFAAKDQVVVVPEVSSWMALASSLPKEYKDQALALEGWVGDRKLTVPFAVESAGKGIPLWAAVVDLDEKGSQARRQVSTDILVAGLTKAGFKAAPITVNNSLLRSATESVILTAWRFQGKTTGRALFGSVSLVTVTGSGTQWNAEVTGTLKVVDLATGAAVYSLKTTKAAPGADKASAAAAGYRAWAEAAALQLGDELP